MTPPSTALAPDSEYSKLNIPAIRYKGWEQSGVVVLSGVREHWMKLERYPPLRTWEADGHFATRDEYRLRSLGHTPCKMVMTVECTPPSAPGWSACRCRH